LEVVSQNIVYELFIIEQAINNCIILYGTENINDEIVNNEIDRILNERERQLK